MKRSEILDTAKEYVTKDRAATHGDMENNFGIIAAYWSTHLDCEVSASDVAVMMTLLKLARIRSNSANADNWIDGAGYLACGGEITTERDTASLVQEARHESQHPWHRQKPHYISDGKTEGLAEHLSQHPPFFEPDPLATRD